MYVSTWQLCERDPRATDEQMGRLAARWARRWGRRRTVRSRPVLSVADTVIS